MIGDPWSLIWWIYFSLLFLLWEETPLRSRFLQKIRQCGNCYHIVGSHWVQIGWYCATIIISRLSIEVSLSSRRKTTRQKQRKKHRLWSDDSLFNCCWCCWTRNTQVMDQMEEYKEWNWPQLGLGNFINKSKGQVFLIKNYTATVWGSKRMKVNPERRLSKPSAALKCLYVDLLPESQTH